MARPLAVYASTEAHSCIRKAVELLGLGTDSLRSVPTDGRLRMDVAALRAAVRADRRKGVLPLCVVGTAGTVNTGAVDPLGAIAELCADEQLWFHVDGAYGGFAALDPRQRDRFRGMTMADSVAVDPHKWLNVPIECGATLVRDSSALEAAFSVAPAYLHGDRERGFGGDYRPSDHGFQLTRGFRALKLWAVLAGVGVRHLADQVARHIDLAAQLARDVEQSPDLELLAPPELSIVCFRYRPLLAGLGPDELNDVNRGIVHAVQEEGDVFVAGTEIGGRYAVRACIVHRDTTVDDVAALVAAVRRHGTRLIASGA
jgi:aromatic-L-amino-acid decarboxylase